MSNLTAWIIGFTSSFGGASVALILQAIITRRKAEEGVERAERRRRNGDHRPGDAGWQKPVSPPPESAPAYRGLPND